MTKCSEAHSRPCISRMKASYIWSLVLRPGGAAPGGWLGLTAAAGLGGSSSLRPGARSLRTRSAVGTKRVTSVLGLMICGLAEMVAPPGGAEDAPGPETVARFSMVAVVPGGGGIWWVGPRAESLEEGRRRGRLLPDAGRSAEHVGIERRREHGEGRSHAGRRGRGHSCKSTQTHRYKQKINSYGEN